MLDGYSLEVALTASNAAAQAWYGYEQVRYPPLGVFLHCNFFSDAL